jgi:galactan 5-O-arabinofuranosyltransferase
VRTFIVNSFNRGAHLDRRGVRSFVAGSAPPVGETALLLAGAAVGAAIVHGFLSASHFTAQSEVARGFGPPWAALMILLAVLGYVAQRRIANPLVARAAVALLAGLAAGFVTAPLTAGLHGTDQPLNTIARGDMQFRTQYITRFAATWHLQDYNFRGLHAFYPPGWFWLAGRSAHVLGLHEAWHIMKPFTILTIGAALAVSFLLWRAVLSPAGALAAAVGSSLVLSPQVGPSMFATQAWYEPYSCFVAVTGVAWLAAVAGTARMRGSPGRLALLALVGVVLALFYYLLFIILAVVLLGLALWPAVTRRATLSRAVGVLAGVALLTAVFWVPLINALIHGAASQGGFVRPDFFRVATGLTGGPAALSILAGVAIAALALTFASSGSQAVGMLFAGTVLYQLISVLTLTLAHNQLQPHRAVTMMWATIGAAVPVALDGYQRRGDGARTLATIALLIAAPAMFALGAAQGTDLASGTYARRAHSPLALSETRQISSFITSTSGKRPDRLVVVSGDRALLVTRPYYGFLPLRARYAHPEAHLAQRIAVLRAAAACGTPACTRRELTTSKFGPIDALVLANAVGGLRIETQEDGFPTPRLVAIFFRPRNFPPALWARRDVGGYAVLVRR